MDLVIFKREKSNVMGKIDFQLMVKEISITHINSVF